MFWVNRVFDTCQKIEAFIRILNVGKRLENVLYVLSAHDSFVGQFLVRPRITQPYIKRIGNLWRFVGNVSAHVAVRKTMLLKRAVNAAFETQILVTFELNIDNRSKSRLVFSGRIRHEFDAFNLFGGERPQVVFFLLC